MLALVQLTELPADDTVIPYVIAVILGLVAAGITLLAIAARIRRRDPHGAEAPAAEPLTADR